MTSGARATNTGTGQSGDHRRPSSTDSTNLHRQPHHTRHQVPACSESEVASGGPLNACFSTAEGDNHFLEQRRDKLLARARAVSIRGHTRPQGREDAQSQGSEVPERFHGEGVRGKTRITVARILSGGSFGGNAVTPSPSMKPWVVNQAMKNICEVVVA
jgi:hypothetical protein